MSALLLRVGGPSSRPVHVAGRFHDPHYLLFARGDAPADAVVTFSALEAKAADDASTAPSMGPRGGPLRLVRHTLPPWLPLAQLAKDLPPSPEAEEDTAEGQGWDLVPDLQRLGGGIEVSSPCLAMLVT